MNRRITLLAVHQLRHHGYTHNGASGRLSIDIALLVKIDIEPAIRVDVGVDQRRQPSIILGGQTGSFTQDVTHAGSGQLARMGSRMGWLPSIVTMQPKVSSQGLPHRTFDDLALAS
jgi:hypothetical protein